MPNRMRHIEQQPQKGPAMGSMFLTAEEIHALTGKVKPSAQIRWLRHQQMAFAVGGDGKPKVLRQLVLTRLGVNERERPEPQLRLDLP